MITVTHHEPLVAIAIQEEALRWCLECGVEAVANRFESSVRTVIEAVAVLETDNDGCGLTAGYSYVAPILPATVTSLGGLFMGRFDYDRCQYCETALHGGIPRPQLHGFDLDIYLFSDSDPQIVFWVPQQTWSH